MSVSYLGPVIAAAVTMLAVYYLFRILMTTDAGQLRLSERPKPSADDLDSAKGKIT